MLLRVLPLLLHGILLRLLRPLRRKRLLLLSRPLTVPLLRLWFRSARRHHLGSINQATAPTENVAVHGSVTGCRTLAALERRFQLPPPHV